MAPPPAVSIMWGTTSRVSRKAEVTLKRKACSKARSLVRSSGWGGQPPALLTRMSMRPNSASVASTRASSCGALGHVGGHGQARGGRWPAPVRRSASICSGVRAAQTTSAPTSARATAMPGTDAAARAGHDGYLVGHLEQVEDHRSPWVEARPSSGRPAGNRTSEGHIDDVPGDPVGHGQRGPRRHRGGAGPPRPRAGGRLRLQRRPRPAATWARSAGSTQWA